MSAILLPIKPVYTSKILEKNKLYEYRKNRCQKDINRIIIYCTSPIKKVLGEVEVIEIISNTPEKLWQETKEYSGISKDKYMQYFKNKTIAYAYKLCKVTVYDPPKTLADLGINFYPQSFIYLDN